MKKVIKNILIVGGSSGLGLELAKQYSELGHHVFITGRKDPKVKNIKFYNFDISSDSQKLISNVEKLILQVPSINTLIYAAGFYQDGTIDKISDTQILEMVNIGLTAPALLIQRLKNNPFKPLKIMLITSSSQYTPREKEPLYTMVKAGLGMLGNSLSLDPEIGKVLVAAPSGMQTPFWVGTDKDTSEMLDPKWVAQQIIELSSGLFKYKYAKILKGPSRVETVEQR